MASDNDTHANLLARPQACSSNTSFLVLLSTVPALLDVMLDTNTVWSTRKKGMNMLSQVSKEAHSAALQRVQSFSINLLVSEEHTPLVPMALLMSSLHPYQLGLTLSPDPKRLEGLIHIVGPSVVGGITHILLVADKPVQIEADTIACALAMPGLKHVSLDGASLVVPMISSALSGMTQLTQLTLSNVYSGPLFDSFLLALHACSSLQILTLDLLHDDEGERKATNNLPTTIRQLHTNGDVSDEPTQAGFFNTVHTLTMKGLPGGCNNLNKLFSEAPNLQKLVLRSNYGVQYSITGAAGLPKSFQLQTGSIALTGSSNDIRDILERSSLKVRDCSITLDCAQPPDLDPGFLSQFPSKCLGVRELTIKANQSFGYRGNGGFLKPLAGCSSLEGLRVGFPFPEANLEGLCSLLLSMPALNLFSGVKCMGLGMNAQEVEEEMYARGRVMIIQMA